MSRPCRVGFAHQPDMLLHEPHSNKHPETPARLSVPLEHLRTCSLLARCEPLHATRRATDEELTSVHTEEHLERVAAATLAVQRNPDDRKLREPQGDGAIYYHEATEDAARCAVGSVLEAMEAVLREDVRDAFALVRPPGHHAEADEALGFCFYNAAAVAAAVARQKHGVERVAILDWDVHHGNGTQHIFDADPNVLFMSLHRFGRGFFPGTGDVDEVGEGAGRGRTVNVPWMQAGLGDADYAAAFELVVMPILREFCPSLLIISAGFDAAVGDIQGKMKVTAAGFAHLTRELLTLPGCPTLAIFEGGYQPPVCATCIEAVLREMITNAGNCQGSQRAQAAGAAEAPKGPSVSRGAFAAGSLGQHTEQTLRHVIGIQSEFWECLRGDGIALLLEQYFGSAGSRKRRSRS